MSNNTAKLLALIIVGGVAKALFSEQPLTPVRPTKDTIMAVADATRPS